jgi:PBSX family phage terminase large subunit
MAYASVTVTYRPRGAAQAIFACRDPEVVLCGAAGTGKSRALLEKLHLVMLKYPGARGLMLRKTRRSLTESGMVTFEQKVLHPLDSVLWRATLQQYQYPNGSIVAVGGLDKPGKIMSSEWDMVYVQEATDLDEQDWEAITTRLRNGKMPYQQLLADCNPDGPQHWLRLRMDAGKTKEFVSIHENNPLLFDGGDWTMEGRRYLAVLDALTGTRHARLRWGKWVAAEGGVYEESWDRLRNLVDRFPIPAEWPRYLSIDFGYNHAFVCQWWAKDSDGRLYRYREIYKTRTLVEDHARLIHNVSRWGEKGGDPFPVAIICDHDAEDRATLERHLGLITTPARKAVSEGIQAVASRMRPAGDSKARLFLLRDSLIERDHVLIDCKLPTCTEEEIDGYRWRMGNGVKHREEPIKELDNGMDAMRYCVNFVDQSMPDVQVGQTIGW